MKIYKHDFIGLENKCQLLPNFEAIVNYMNDTIIYLLTDVKEDAV